MQPQNLVSIPLFSSLPVEEIRQLESTLSAVEFPAGQVLLREGRTDERFFILLEGKIEVVKSLGKPEERILGVRGAGNLLGEMSLFTREGHHTASIRSLTPLKLLKVTRDELDALLHRQPLFAYEIISLLSRRLEESENLTILDLKEKNQRLEEAYEELKAAQQQIIEKERLDKELEISRNIQQSILPEALPVIAGYQFGALMIPARAVGGDFFTFIKVPENKLGILVGDVSDKGVPAALFMALSYSLIRAEAVRTSSPVEVVRKVNEHLLQMNSSSMYVTLVYGILDDSSGSFHFARVAHPAPYLLDEEGNCLTISPVLAQPLGLFEDPPIDEQTIHIPPGGILLLYSDGVTETMDREGIDFGLDSLHNTLQTNQASPSQEICEKLWQDVQAHAAGSTQQDDFTCVIIKRSANR